MGLFSRKNKEDKMNGFSKMAKQSMQAKPSEEYLAQVKRTDRGREIEYFDANADPEQLYDTTKLVVQNRSMDFPDSNVYNCLVSWYNDSDHLAYDEKRGFVRPSSEVFSSVLAQIDLHLLETDPIYQKQVMLSLLEKERVEEKYLKTGQMTLDEMQREKAKGNPNIKPPCGRYIGGVDGPKYNYKKFFDGEIGIKAHNMMKVEREAARRRKLEKIAQQNAEYEAKIRENRSKMREIKQSSERDDYER